MKKEDIYYNIGLFFIILTIVIELIREFTNYIFTNLELYILVIVFFGGILLNAWGQTLQQRKIKNK